MPKDRIDFKIEWTSGEKATLIELYDNDKPILRPEAQNWADSKIIEVCYEVDSFEDHSISWVLLFPNCTLKKLKASASKNGGEVELLVAADSKSERWSAAGSIY